MKTKQDIIRILFKQKQYPKILHIITSEEKEFDYDEWTYLQSKDGELEIFMAIDEYEKNNNKVGKAGDRFLHRANIYYMEKGVSYLV